ncbi:MAG: adenosylhomocysteinase [Fimbriimonadales bacterium]|nr:MAG: adenosylhomocysteinase [Fimbriimonadales bacterium]
MNYDVKDIALAEQGALRMEWADNEMPVLRLIRQRFEQEKPLQGVRIAACLHVTTETGNLMRTLKAGGAEITLCASNPLSTQDDLAAALVKYEGIRVFAIKGEDKDTYYKHIHQALDIQPQITMDDGCDLVSVLHTDRKEGLASVIGGTEETTTGVIRLRAMAKEGVLQYPVIAINDAYTKHLFDNRYGTGQSTMDAIMRATNLLIAGRKVVVIGYGWCGRGVAMRARGLGAHVIVCEVDPLKALEAIMDGYEVMTLAQAAQAGDIFITVTGNYHVLREEHFRAMKSGAIVCNTGHFNVEIDIPALERMATGKRTVRAFVDEYQLSDGRRLYLLGEGRLINLAAAEGHPAAVMDMSFANQALSVEYIVKRHSQLPKEVFPVPTEIDAQVAQLKLQAMGVQIDTLTDAQAKYLDSWQEGT